MKEHGITTFNDAAMADWERRIDAKWPGQKPPPEEEPCGECEGIGEIVSRVELGEALLAIGAVNPRQLPDWQERQDAVGIDLL